MPCQREQETGVRRIYKEHSKGIGLGLSTPPCRCSHNRHSGAGACPSPLHASKDSIENQASHLAILRISHRKSFPHHLLASIETDHEQGGHTTRDPQSKSLRHEVPLAQDRFTGCLVEERVGGGRRRSPQPVDNAVKPLFSLFSDSLHTSPAHTRSLRGGSG